MATKILLRRGEDAELTASTLTEGEPAFTTDTLKFIVGTDDENYPAGYVTVNDTANINYSGNALQYIEDDDNLTEIIQNTDARFGAVNSNIQTLVGDISTNTSNISTNTSNVSALQSTTSGLSTSISLLTGEFDTHTHGSISTSGQITESAEATLGDKLLIADASDTFQVKSSTEFSGEQTEFLNGQGDFVPLTTDTTIATKTYVDDEIQSAQLGGVNLNGLIEWVTVGKIENTDGDNITVNTTNLGEALDFDNYDYKFVLDASTSLEDNSTVLLEFNESGADRYVRYLVTRTNFDGTSDILTANDPILERVITGISLPTSITGIVATAVNTEFTISKINYDSLAHGTLYLVKGNATVYTMESIDTENQIEYSEFRGSLQSDTDLTSFDVLHGMDGGSNDYASVRVFKRAK